MISAFERTVAFRYLRARRQEGFVSIIAAFSLAGIALGVATLIVVMAVMNGFRAELLDRILGINGHIMVYAQGRSMEDYDVLGARIARVPGVASVAPLVEGQVMASSPVGASGALVRGMRAADLARRPLVADHIVAGSFGEYAAGRGVLVGSRLAARLGIVPGDRITLISPRGVSTALGTVPRVRAFRVAGLFEIGMFEYDSAFVFMPLHLAQVYFRTGAGVSALEVMLDDPRAVGTVRPKVAAALGGQGRLVDWRQINAHFFNAIEVERNVMFVILTLIVLVAAFNIVSGLVMLVKDKSQDIAILRTMGATRASIMRIFLINGASVGVVGTLLGLGLGVAFAANIDTIRVWLEGLTGAELFAPEIRFLSQLPARIDVGEVVAVVALALGLSFLATLYPSWRAARLDPVEVLRYE